MKRWVLTCAPAAIWAVHLTFAFLATVTLCPGSPVAARTTLLIAGGLALVSTAALCAASVATWIRLRRRESEAIEARESNHLLGLAAVFVGFTSLLGVLLIFVPAFTLTPACEMWR